MGRIHGVPLSQAGGEPVLLWTILPGGGTTVPVRFCWLCQCLSHTNMEKAWNSVPEERKLLETMALSP